MPDSPTNTYIRSSRCSLKFANANKRMEIQELCDEYKRVVQEFVDMLWDMHVKQAEKIPSLLPKEQTSQIKTWLSARMIQCAAKQASGVVRGTIRKHKKREAQYAIFVKSGQFKKARKLRTYISKVSLTKPELKTCQLELDSRFVDINLDATNSFDIWVTLSSIRTDRGKGYKIVLPMKRTSHFNGMLAMDGCQMKGGVRLGRTSMTFMFSLPEVEKMQNGRSIGIDIGINNVISTSDGQVSAPDKHGHTLGSIIQRMSRKSKGSNGFARCQKHRRNYINWCVNRLDLTGVSVINMERIRNMRFRRNVGRGMSHFVYRDIFGKLRLFAEDHGVRCTEKSPTYTSQRCSQCGWVCKVNRHGKRFKCVKCGYAHDADLNAAMNLNLELEALEPLAHLKQANRAGFYWQALSQAPIVPDAQKTLVIA